VLEAEGNSQRLQKQEKVYPVHFESPMFVALGVMLLILFIVGAVVANIHAYDLGELMRGEPQAPPGSLLHAAEVRNIEDAADTIRIGSLAFIALEVIALVAVAILASTGRMMREIALADAGIVLRRRGLGPWAKPITMQRISEMKEVSRGRALKLVGVTPEGRKVTKQLSKLAIGGKRWEEFKNDLQGYIAPAEKE
jgi:hypothetical protein